MSEEKAKFTVETEFEANEDSARKAGKAGAEAEEKAYRERKAELMRSREAAVNPAGSKFGSIGNDVNAKFSAIGNAFAKLKENKVRKELEQSILDPKISVNRDVQGASFRAASALADSDYAKDDVIKGMFGGTVLQSLKQELQPILESTKEFFETFKGVGESIRETNVELKNTREIMSSFKSLGIKEFFFKGTDYAALNNSIKAQRSLVDRLKPSESDYTLASKALNRGKWTNEARSAVKEARARIATYNQELAALKRLEKDEEAPTGGLFSKRFAKAFNDRLGVFSDKNSIFDKKTLKSNGLFSAVTFRGLRGFEVALGTIKKPLKAVSGLWHRFTRRLGARLITNAVKAVIRLAKEGLKNLDKYSEHMGTPFHNNVMRLSASLLYLKNAFAAMAGPIVNALTPALERLMDTFAALANNIGAFFAAITGQNQFSAALKKTITETKTAAGKLKDILAFDELNRLSGETGGDQSADEMFEEWGEGTIFQQIRDAIAAGEWESIGELLAEKVNDMVSKIKENKVGKLIGEKLGKAIKVARSFLENLDFTNMGATLAEQINGMLEGIDWNDVGRLIFRLFSGALDFFAGLIRNLNWGAIAKAIGDLFTGVFNGAADWIRSIDWGKIGSELIANIVKFFENLSLGDIITAVFNLLKAVLEAGIQLVGGILGSILDGLFPGFRDWFDKLKQKIVGWMPDWMKEIFGIDDKNSTVEITGKVGFSLEGEAQEDIAMIREKVYGQKGALDGVHKQVIDGVATIVRMSNWGKWVNAGSRIKVEGAASGGVSGAAGLISGGSYLTFAASGGTFDKGQLFVANEAGPELVGSVGGKSTVTNQDQFTQGLVDANSMVVEAVMQVVAAVNNKDFDVYMDSQKVGQSVTQYQNSMARRFGY